MFVCQGAVRPPQGQLSILFVTHAGNVHNIKIETGNQPAASALTGR